MSLDRVLIVGTGLIGASVGLALTGQGVDVRLSDRDPRRLALAAELGAGSATPRTDRRLEPGADPFDLVLICVPPAEVAVELLAAQRLSLGLTYSDVTSIKTQPQGEAERIGAELTTFVGGHPVAGRERGGPGNARADLFVGRPWVLTPSPTSAPEAVQAVEQLVALCGARALVMTPEQHDAAMGLVSHLPQVLASVLAGQLIEAEGGSLELAGQGFRDMTRIADSDPQMWGQIAAGNAGELARALRVVTAELTELASLLEGADAAAAERAGQQAVARGNAGRSRLPGKHGEGRQTYESVPVVIVDEPGALARLLADAGAAGVNVEDLALEHSPGAPVGLCELLVRPEQAEHLAHVLRERGWSVHQQGSATHGAASRTGG